MAHFAKIEHGKVTQVIVLDNAVIGEGDYRECERLGRAFIAGLGLDGEWLQTSYNGNFRGVYAGIGFSYDVNSDVFVAPSKESNEDE